jgi:hypothetical protein
MDKTILSVLSGVQDSNIPFADLRNLLTRLGFGCRVKGDHFIYMKNGVEDIINIQPLGNKSKAYQVKQVRNVILKYQMGGELDEI